MSLLVLNRNNGSADEYGHLLALTRFASGGGVIEGLAVIPKTSPNMSVTVGPGTAIIPTGTYPSSYGYDVAIDTASGSPAGESVTIATASSSNPRIDSIVLYVDLSVTASSGTPNNPNNMLKLASVAGTPNASPVAPTNSAIQTAIGASNPFLRLGNVTVGTSVTSISGGILDVRSMTAVNYVKYVGVRAKRSSNLNVPASTETTIVFNAEDFDTAAMHDNSTNPERFTAPVTGYYDVKLKLAFDAWDVSATEYRLIANLYVNGTSQYRILDIGVANNGGNTTIVQSDEMFLHIDDYISFTVFQATPNTRSLTSSTFAAISLRGV
jgi:hypothetical protein